MAKARAADGSHSDDDFQCAATRAETEAGRLRWFEMSPTEQARAIYDELRKIDASRAMAMPIQPARSGRFRVAGEPTKRRNKAILGKPSARAPAAPASRP